MSDIPDFTQTELWSAQSAVDERWGKGEVELHLADIGIKLSPNAEPTECPALFWRVGEGSFVVLKTGENRFRSPFFYQDLAGVDELDNAADATVTLRRMQADCESVRSGAFPQGGPES